MNEPRRQFGSAVPHTGGVAIDQGLRQYMLGVYNYMALGVAATGLLSMLVAGNEQLIRLIAGTPLWWVGCAAILGLGWFAPRIMINGSKTAAHAVFWAYAALWGIMIAPMLYFMQQAGAAQDIYRAFFITSALFGSLSLWGYTTKKDLSGWGSFIFMASIGLVIAIVVNGLIFHSTMFSLLSSCAVVLLFSGATAYQTQAIKSMYREGSAMNERAAIFGAFALYGSFVVLFVHILNILGIMRD